MATRPFETPLIRQLVLVRLIPVGGNQISYQYQCT